MSAIKDGRVSATLRGKEYKLLLSLNAIDAIQDKFGDYDKLDEFMNPQNKESLKTIKWLLALLINEGGVEDGAEPITETDAGRIIYAGNIADVKAAIFATFYTGTQGDSLENSEENEDVERAGNLKGAQELLT